MDSVKKEAIDLLYAGSYKLNNCIIYGVHLTSIIKGKLYDDIKTEYNINDFSLNDIYYLLKSIK